MKITAFKTPIIGVQTSSLEEVLKESLPSELFEKSLVVVSSKIVALLEGSVRPLSTDKEKLFQEEADFYVPEEHRRYGRMAIKNHCFVGAAGIDESNADKQYVLLPRDAMKTAQELHQFLKKEFNLKDFGVIITDSHSTPFRRGALGIALGYAGFQGLKDYRGTADLFGRTLEVEQSNQLDALAAAAVLVMGEGNEQTPVALIEEVSFIRFSQVSPTPEELNEFFVSFTDDIFTPIFDFSKLRPGGHRKNASENERDLL